VEKVHYKIGGMSCSFCVDTIQRALGRMVGVQEVHVSLAHEEALVEYDPAKVSPEELKETLRAVGYTVRDPEQVRSLEEEEEEMRRERDRLVIAVALSWSALVLMALMWLGRMFPHTERIIPVIAVITVFFVGRPILKMAWGSLRRWIFNQHVLLEFAAFAGLIGGILGLYFLAFPAMDFFAVSIFVTTYHILSQYTSLLVRTRSSQAVRKLLSLQPATAVVLSEGKEEEIPADQVRTGDLVRVRPGSQIAVDGEIVDGASAVDESLVTGEPLPKDKVKGDAVIGGSLNQAGTLVIRATRVGRESFLQQVARYIREARALKPGVIQLADRILKYFVPGVLAFAAGAFLFWTAGAWLFTGNADLIRATYAALAVLVMGYPCALGMATPLAMIRGGGEAALRGILMRSGEAFQVFKDVRTVALDKTGTITAGKPEVTQVICLAGDRDGELLALAASAERPSEHPVARSVVTHAETRGIALQEARDFSAVPGLGIHATVGQKKVRIGSLRFLEDEGIDTGAGSEAAAALEAEGKTVIGVAVNHVLAGLLTVSDLVKADAGDAIREMKRAGLTPLMMTGDNERTAKAIAATVGIEEVYSQVLPQEKAQKIRELQRRGVRVAMVGDGINDAPALMQADVGVAIGAGTDIAIDSSDVILVGARLGGFVDAYHIARRSFRKTVQNLVLAFTFNGVGVPLAAAGWVHPAWAMIAMAASVSTVLLNSFAGRLLPRDTEEKTGEISEAGPVDVISFKVPSIHCEGCVQVIRDAFARFPQVAKTVGEAKEKRIFVTVKKGSLTPEQLRGEISRLGHVVEEV
jgi:P-type Cu+ transporter